MKSRLVALLFGIASSLGAKTCPMEVFALERGRVAVDEFRDQGDITLTREAGKDLIAMLSEPRWGGRYNGASFALDRVQRRTAIDPLSSLDVTPYEGILQVVKMEAAFLGLNAGYEITPVHKVSDLATNAPIPLFLVDKLWNNFRVSATGTESSGRTFPVTYEYFTAGIGEGSSVYDYLGGKLTRCDASIFISPNKVVTERLGMIYCEVMHHALRDVQDDLLLHYAPHEGVGRAIEFGVLTEEAVVHGLFLDWLREHQDSLQVSGKEFRLEQKKNEGSPRYVGVRVMKSLAKEMGRRALVDAYKADPVSFWQKVEPYHSDK